MAVSAPHGFGIGNGHLGLGSGFRVWDRDWVNFFTPVSFGNRAGNIPENPIIWERVWEWDWDCKKIFGSKVPGFRDF